MKLSELFTTVVMITVNILKATQEEEEREQTLIIRGVLFSERWRAGLVRHRAVSSQPSFSVQPASSSTFREASFALKNVSRATGTSIRIFTSLPRVTQPASPARRERGCSIRGQGTTSLAS